MEEKRSMKEEGKSGEKENIRSVEKGKEQTRGGGRSPTF